MNINGIVDSSLLGVTKMRLTFEVCLSPLETSCPLNWRCFSLSTWKKNSSTSRSMASVERLEKKTGLCLCRARSYRTTPVLKPCKWLLFRMCTALYATEGRGSVLSWVLSALTPTQVVVFPSESSQLCTVSFWSRTIEAKIKSKLRLRFGPDRSQIMLKIKQLVYLPG